MFVKPDVNLVARMLISQHGWESRELAERKVDELDTLGDAGGEAYWRLILTAIDEELTQPLNPIYH